MFITPGSSSSGCEWTLQPRSEVITNGHNAETVVTVNENALVDGDISKRLNDADHENGDDDVEDCNKANLVDGKPQESSKAHSTYATQSIQERLSTVVLRGYQHKVEEAKAKLEAMIQQQLSQVTEELCIPAEVHSQLIGSRGYAIHKVMQEFHVRIEFPVGSSRNSDANRVLVTGDQKDVDLACDHLIAKANDLLDRLNPDSRPVQSTRYLEELLPTSGPA
ncbi:High-density lipoprotein receptor (Hdl) [Fasciola gigantica]|uniref:High-density lipoprotein receptor (Hdl) n=1 Tax=Fasciola gigantica TaxID=46835 RepID=A0A504Z1C5_FASGI|nr:High-density lipoprotein receptor (Hdl) [Fasciola gigantica]